VQVSLLHLADITEEGVNFQSPVDGERMLLTPEHSIQIQNRIGADIIMALDDVVSSVTVRQHGTWRVGITATTVSPVAASLTGALPCSLSHRLAAVATETPHLLSVQTDRLLLDGHRWTRHGLRRRRTAPRGGSTDVSRRTRGPRSRRCSVSYRAGWTCACVTYATPAAPAPTRRDSASLAALL